MIELQTLGWKRKAERFGGYRTAFYYTWDKMTKFGLKASVKPQDNAIIWQPPFTMRRLLEEFKGNGKKIAYTMFETVEWADEFLDNLNQVDAVIVPSEWNKQGLIDSGYTKPVYVAPHGYQKREFPLLDRRKERREEGLWTFLHYNAGELRKGWDLVLKAFIEEFKPEDKVKLILKTFGQHEVAINEFLTSTDSPMKKKVEVISYAFDKKTMRRMMNRSDVFVFPSRGEGLGMPPLEAMSTGMQCIATKAHAHLDFWHDDMLPVSAKLVKSPYMTYINKSKQMINDCESVKNTKCHWYEPNLEELKKQMRWTYEHQEESRKAGKRSAKFVKANWGMEKKAEGIAKVIKEILGVDENLQKE